MAERDPRVDPQDGDVLKKWDRCFLVIKNTQGCVFTQPPLSAHREWVGILYFQRWAQDSEVR